MRSVIVAVLALYCSCCFTYARQEQPVTPSQELMPEAAELIRKSYNLPPGSKIILERTSTKDGGTLQVQEEAMGQGARLKASGKDIVSDFNAGAPNAALGDGHQATGSDTNSSVSIKGGTSLWSNPLLWLGVLCVIVAGASLIVRPPAFPVAIPIRVSIIVGLVGAGFIATAIVPMLLVWCVIAVIVALVGMYVYREFAHQRAEQAANEGKVAKSALRSVAAGISDFKKAANNPGVTTIPPTAWAELKSLLASHIEEPEKAVITEIRNEDRLA